MNIAELLAAPFDQGEFRDCPGRAGFRVSAGGLVETDKVLGSPNGRRSGIWRAKKICFEETGHAFVWIGHHRIYVHRLVLEAFVGPCPDGKECLHGDGNPKNNRLDNLRWGTRLENIADTMAMGRVPSGESHWNCRISDEVVCQIFKHKNSGMRVVEIAKLLNLNHQIVSKILLGQRRSNRKAA